MRKLPEFLFPYKLAFNIDFGMGTAAKTQHTTVPMINKERINAKMHFFIILKA